MPHPPTRRNRGLQLALPPRARSRRHCREGGSPAKVPAEARFRVAIERLSDSGAALGLKGELDLAAVPALEGALRRIERWSVSSVLVDAAEVSFVDLMVMGRLAAAHGRLVDAGGGLVVINPPECLLRMLEVLDDLELPVVR